MKILLTGATGYIAQRLLPKLLSANHYVYCCVRDKGRFDLKRFENPGICLIEVDLLREEALQNIPSKIDIAYYLVHSRVRTMEISKKWKPHPRKISKEGCCKLVFNR